MQEAEATSQAIPVRSAVVIDDEEAVQKFMCVMMRDWGIDAVASSSLGTVEPERLASADFIFIDMHMPGTDGIQVLEHLARRKVPSRIVLMSGTHSEVLVAAERIARQQGLRVVGTLRKPFRAGELRRILEEQPPAAEPVERMPRSSDINIEDLVEGLERREFDVFLQPIVALATGEVFGYEALARWRSEKFSLVMPDRFISLAARHGLLAMLTRQVIQKALGYSAKLRTAGLPHRVSINVASEDLVDKDLPERLAAMTALHGLSNDSMSLELTESSAIGNETKLLETLARIHLKGFGLAIDDFGTSYSGLERLSVIPFSSLKIDMRFVADMMTNDNARTIIEASIALAKRLHMHTVAEGIETEAQLSSLRDLGCEFGQGYLIGRPMDYESLLAWHELRRAADAPAFRTG